MPSDQENSCLSFHAVRTEIQNKQAGKKRFLQIIMQIAAAVSIPVLLVAGWQLTNERRDTIKPVSVQQYPGLQQNILNNIVLSTEDEEFNLSAGHINIERNGFKIESTGKMLKLKQSVTKHNPAIAQEQQWSTLRIPGGKDYYAELPDGTQVWINAGSKLTFPNFFNADKRVVQLEGEAYFKVKSDKKHPFYVETPYETVCVTGTQFNVCAYLDEPHSRITLAEGEVRVKINNKIHQLHPGEQLQQSKKNADISISKVDVELYTSWKDGVFIFRDMTLEDISYRLSKWYDTEFDFTNPNLLNQRFTGMTKKEYSIEYFLKVIEKTSNVEFAITKTDIKVKEL